jgi:hypothetical protein
MDTKTLYNFYVYAYLDPFKPGLFSYSNGFVQFEYEPFYIGKGYARRYQSKQGRTLWFLNKRAKIRRGGKNPIIVKLYTNLTEDRAFELENKLITIIGRRDCKEGCLLNCTDGGEGKTGFKLSDETKAKISRSLIGNKIPEEVRKKISKSHKGKKIPQEVIEKIRAKTIGKKRSEDTKKKISIIQKGKIISDKQRREQSEFMKSDKNPWRGRRHSEETKAKWSLLRKGMAGRPHTEEAKRKISEIKIGKHPSEETKRKISETLLRRNRLCENIIQPSGMEDFI